MKRYILTLLAIISLIAVSATNQTSQKNGTQTSPEVDELLSEDEVLSGEFRIPKDMYLDSPNEAPMLVTWFDTPQKIDFESGCKLYIGVYEQTNLYNGTKDYSFYLDVRCMDFWRSISTKIAVGVSKNKMLSIIQALRRINEYYNKSLATETESITFVKDLTSSVGINFNFSYNPDNYKWEGNVKFYTEDATFNMMSQLSVPSTGFCIIGRFKDVKKDLPSLIESLERGISSIDARVYEQGRKLLIETQTNGDKLYYWDENSQYDDLPITSIEYIDKRFFYGNKYVEDKNKILKDIIKDNNPKISTLGKYGYIDIVWNPYGGVVNAKLMISKDAAWQISERTIKIMLNKIREFKIKKYQTTKDEECEYMRVAIPLEMEE